MKKRSWRDGAFAGSLIHAGLTLLTALILNSNPDAAKGLVILVCPLIFSLGLLEVFLQILQIYISHTWVISWAAGLFPSNLLWARLGGLVALKKYRQALILGGAVYVGTVLVGYGLSSSPILWVGCFAPHPQNRQ